MAQSPNPQPTADFEPGKGQAKSPDDYEGFESLPLVDEFRTLCVAPSTELQGVFEGLKAVAA